MEIDCNPSCDTVHGLLAKILRNQSVINSSVNAITTATGGPATSITTGPNVTVVTPGVAVQGPNLPCAKGVLLVAFATNTKNIYAGGSNVNNTSRQGVILSTLGMPSQIIPVSNANLLWFDADVGGEGVGLIAL